MIRLKMLGTRPPCLVVVFATLSVDGAGAVDRAHDERHRRQPGRGNVARARADHDLVDSLRRYEGNRTAAEAGAREARAVRTRADERVDEHVELGRRHPEVVAE
jgi:hypothetical protein